MEMDLKHTNHLSMITAAPAAPVVMLNANAMPLMGRTPQLIKCSNCHNLMQTRLERRANKNTHILALLLCLTGLWCFMPLPYCLKSCRSLDHYCSCCNQYLGKAVN
ncbi:lipopolysaccharide-induced tumor necrosis factor-alpha factor homolog [Drosophila grimshawi]|uniref:GH19765 n=1 Tax=Drosophila grimshawi TaxID=7222 RepID=B4J442_DROGR|nr:lipopolysaccharide-induced tumor necrosis factor-alpha factor homolog [Drosophila grimshawi]EDW02648.1 GH19765 [Drosophila grimshawi]